MRGVRGNSHPYRDPQSATLPHARRIENPPQLKKLRYMACDEAGEGRGCLNGTEADAFVRFDLFPAHGLNRRNARIEFGPLVIKSADCSAGEGCYFAKLRGHVRSRDRSAVTKQGSADKRVANVLVGQIGNCKRDKRDERQGWRALARGKNRRAKTEHAKVAAEFTIDARSQPGALDVSCGAVPFANLQAVVKPGGSRETHKLVRSPSMFILGEQPLDIADECLTGLFAETLGIPGPLFLAAQTVKVK